MRISKEYRAWKNMKSRCLSKSNSEYHNYGKRGIGICKRWCDSFYNFLEDMGRCPEDYTLDRIDNDGNYEPANCRWASRRTQRRNMRNTRLDEDKIVKIFELRREGKAQTKIAKEVGVTQAMVSLVLRREIYQDYTEGFEDYRYHHRNQYTMPE